MVNEGRVPHALMFVGQEGSGTLPTALAFIQYLFCKNRAHSDSCHVCHSCLKIQKLIHPDLHFVFPINKSKEVKVSSDLIKEFRELFLETPYLTLSDWFNSLNAENKQPIIPTEEANSILKKLAYTSYEGSYKVMLIWQPEKMNLESANKLLKILEEPPEQTLFILVCNNPNQLLSTILSRVQQILFQQLDSETIAQALIQQYGCTSSLANQTALLSGGSFREAQLLIQNSNSEADYLQSFRTFMLTALNFNPQKAIIWIDEHARIGRERQKQFLQYSLNIFRDCLMLNYGSKGLINLSGSENEFMNKFSKFVHQKNYEKLINEFNAAFYHIERNANPKIVFMDLIMNTNELINLSN